MLIESIEADLFGTNCFVVAPGPGERCVVIDPGMGVAKHLDAVLAEHRLHPAAVLLTHGHLDHTFSVLPVCQARDVPAYIHSADRGALADPWPLLGMPPGTPLPGIDSLTIGEPDDVRELADGSRLELAGLQLTVRHTPGHTRGSILFLTDADLFLTDADQGPDRTGAGGAPVAFTGDLLFAGSIGRTDMPGGSMAQLRQSLVEVVLPLPDEVMVCPGHGPGTTIGRERATNPYLRELT